MCPLGRVLYTSWRNSTWRTHYCLAPVLLRMKNRGPVALVVTFLDMGIPSKAVTDFQSNIFGMVYCLQHLDMQNILVLEWVSRSSNMQSLAFTQTGVHFTRFPRFSFVERVDRGDGDTGVRGRG